MDWSRLRRSSRPDRDPAAPVTQPLPHDLIAGHERWRKSRYPKQHALLSRLAEGQSPRTMVISCSDSRVNALDIFSAGPGDLFMVRNVANIVPPLEGETPHHAVSSAVEYAVQALRVAHIVVLGHSGCGGVHAARDLFSGKAPELKRSDSLIGPWVGMLRPAWEELSSTDGQIAPVEALEREATLLSVRNLTTYPAVADALDSGSISLHAAWIDVASARLEVHRPGRGFVAI